MPAFASQEIDRARVSTFLGSLVAFWLLFELVTVVTNVGMIQLAPIYMFTPFGAALITVWRNDVGFLELGLRLGRVRWLVIAAVVPLLIALVTTGVALVVPGIEFSPGVVLLPGVALPSGVPGLLVGIGIVLTLGITVNAVLAVGEEVGWRGYLLWELAPLGFWRASASIGVIWGLWHAPVIVEGYNYPSFPLLGVLVMTLAAVTFSFLYTYLVVRARSVLAAVFFHGVFNASGGLVLAYTAADSAALSELVASPVGVASMITFLTIAGGILLLDQPELRRDRLFEASD